MALATRTNSGATLRKRKPRLLYAAHLDIPLLLILLTLMAIGLICLFSASHVYANYYEESSYYFIQKQGLFAVLGLIVMFVLSLVDYHIWHKLAFWLWLISIALLLAVLVLPSSIGVHRWINLPVVGGFQPSEFAKFTIILLFAQFISTDYKKMHTFRTGFLKLVLYLGGTCGLIVIEPHLSGTILVLLIGLTMMFVGGTRTHYLVLLILGGAAAVLFMVMFKGYEADRIAVWLDPLGVFAQDRDQAWQTVQSLYAIGSGGLMGLGLGNSRQKHLFLPEPQNDFIFAIVCEELGFVGAALILFLFALLVWRGIVIAMRAKDKFGAMLAIGISAQIGFQVALNVGVVSNAMPNTGIGLPFFSYGGTSMLMLLGEMGILMSVARQMRPKGTPRSKE
ncbi:MAG: putative lipid II flippase FtsW [Clostridia bacterium]|nr:putative lipid II flippase FtsW [Clostridia bacterium]